MTELTIHYSDVDGRGGRIFLQLFSGAFAAGGLWFLYLFIAYPPSEPAGAALAWVLLTTFTWLATWLTIFIAVMSWRSVRGHWWLRLSSNGLEINDRIFRRRRIRWGQVHNFMLVAPAGHFEHAVMAQPQSFADAMRNGVDHPVALQVGFRLGHDLSRSLWRRLFANFRDRDGVLADGILMGFWDRSPDEAVNLLNEWRLRYTRT